MAWKKGPSILPANVALDTKKQKAFVHKIKKLQSKYDDGLKPDRGVIYLSHIPHGFYETEMRSFFSQFGKVTRLRLSRSKRTGNSKGYAYIEFEDAEVAQIAADTMNNYLMFERLLKCELIPSDKVHQKLFVGCYRAFSKPKSSQLSIQRHNTVKTEFHLKKLQLKSKLKQKKKLLKLAALGIHLDLDNILVISHTDSKISSPKTPMSEKGKKASETPIQKVIPTKITTPEGDLMVLVEDESESEITFKTPPNSIRSSKLTASGKRKNSSDETPRTSKPTSKILKSPQPSVEKSLQYEPTDVKKIKPEITPKTKKVKPEITPKTKKMKQEIVPKTKKVKQEIEPKTKKAKQEIVPKTKKVKQEIEPKTKKVKQETTPKSEPRKISTRSSTRKITTSTGDRRRK